MEIQHIRSESRIQFYSHLKKYLCNGKCPFCEKLHNYLDEVKPKPGQIGRVFCPEHKYLRYGGDEGSGYLKRDKTGARRGNQ